MHSLVDHEPEQLAAKNVETDQMKSTDWYLQYSHAVLIVYWLAVVGEHASVAIALKRIDPQTHYMYCRSVSQRISRAATSACPESLRPWHSTEYCITAMGDKLYVLGLPPSFLGQKFGNFGFQKHLSSEWFLKVIFFPLSIRAVLLRVALVVV